MSSTRDPFMNITLEIAATPPKSTNQNISNSQTPAETTSTTPLSSSSSVSTNNPNNPAVNVIVKQEEKIKKTKTTPSIKIIKNSAKISIPPKTTPKTTPKTKGRKPGVRVAPPVILGPDGLPWYPSLSECLSAFTEVESLSRGNSFICPGCGKVGSTSKKLSLLQLPAVLCVQLKRFSRVKGKFIKKHTWVNFPLQGK